MVYRVECRPLFWTVWSAAALRLGNKRFALAIVFHVGGGLGMRKVTPQPEMSTPSRVLQSPQAWKHGLLLVADGHGGDCPLSSLSQTIRTQSASARSARCGGVEPDSVGRA